MTYSDKLRHPKWQRKRLEILQRDDFTCQLCNDTETELHVHHKDYDNKNTPWEVDNDFLITYCKFCHKMVEQCKSANFSIMEVEIVTYADGIIHNICRSFNDEEMSWHIIIFEISKSKEISYLSNIPLTSFLFIREDLNKAHGQDKDN